MLVIKINVKGNYNIWSKSPQDASNFSYREDLLVVHSM
jgi:hypothetical protein